MKYRTLSLLILLFGFTALLAAEEPKPATTANLTAEQRVRCLRTLRAGIQSDEFWPSMHAAEALTLAGAKEEVVAALRDRLPLERDDQQRCGLARELVRTGDRSQLKVLFEILGDAQSNGRVHAAESLYKVGEVGDKKLLLAAMAQDENAVLRIFAAAALARADHAGARDVVRADLDSEDQKVRNIVGFTLALVGQESDVEPLSKALDRETDLVARAYLINALANRGDERGLRAQKKNLAADDVSIRTMAADGAGYSRNVSCQADLLNLLDDETLDVRVRAAQSLIRLSQPEK